MRRSASLLLTGLLLACAPAIPASAQAASPPAVTATDPYAAHIAEAAQRFAIPDAWIRAVMRTESRGDRRAVSPKGAMGLMQIMPDTWAGLRARHGLGRDPFDPRDNILAGAAYLRELQDRYGNVTAMLAAYNAGPGRYEASLSGRALPAETRAYVTTIAQAIDGGGSVGPALTASATSVAWTRAPLFAGRSERIPAAVPVPAERLPGDTSTVVASSESVRDVSAIVPHSGGLFVARAEQGQRP